MRPIRLLFGLGLLGLFASGCNDRQLTIPGDGGGGGAGGDGGATDGWTGMSCGGFAGLPCPSGFFCELPPGTCHNADQSGTCAPTGASCPGTGHIQPVCGCDGKTYGDDCERINASVSKDHDGECGARVVCAGLTETACSKSGGCVADYCMECSCTSTFVGCRAQTDPKTPCPLGEGLCPNPMCCRAQADCQPLGEICRAPDALPFCGGACQMPPPCQTDADCGQGGPIRICDPAPCTCNSGIKTCLLGCSKDADCAEGTTCDTTHRCSPQLCPMGTGCPSDFVCTPGRNPPGPTCIRRTCMSDPDCGSGFCVEGSCYKSLGQCSGPPPP